MLNQGEGDIVKGKEKTLTGAPAGAVPPHASCLSQGHFEATFLATPSRQALASPSSEQVISNPPHLKLQRC